MVKEEWRDVEGYEGLYRVSSLGNVESLERYVDSKRGGTQLVHRRILKPQVINNYLAVALCKDGTVTRKTIHRLVASAFLEKESSDDVVNHKDANKKNNCVDNLEWCTQKHNVEHSMIKGLRSQDKRSRRVVRSDGAEFASVNTAAKETGVSYGNLWSHLHGRRNHVGGYTFKYKE